MLAASAGRCPAPRRSPPRRRRGAARRTCLAQGGHARRAEPGHLDRTVPMSRLRRWRWWVIANRCASSRMRWKRKSASLLRGGITGSRTRASRSPRVAWRCRTGRRLDAGLAQARSAAATWGCRRRRRGGWDGRRTWRRCRCGRAIRRRLAVARRRAVAVRTGLGSPRYAGRRVSTWWIESVSSVEFGMVNRRYSSLRGRPSSNTTMDATMFVPLRCDTSKHSMRSGVGHAQRLLDVLERLGPS